MIQRIGVVPLGEIQRDLLKRSAAVLAVERVSYWSMESDGSAIHREIQFTRSTSDFDESPLCLRDVDYPSYFEALQEGSNLMVADDTMADPRLVEFRESYFPPLGISSMLDAPVHRNGRLFGVICHEHIGPKRSWTTDEVGFARYLAQWIALAVEIECRHKTETALRQSEETYRRVIEHTPVPTVVVDLELGRFVDANESAARLYGRNREILLQGGPADFSPPLQPDGRPSSESAREKITVALAGEDSKFEWMHRGADGREIPCIVHLAPFPGGDGKRVIAVVTDRTEQLRTEDAIRRALDSEKELNELRSRFTAIVSHEFRTPLGIIVSAADLMKNYFDRLDGAKREELLDDIRQSARQMAGLMEQVLVLGRADSGNLGFAAGPVDLEGICAKLADESNSVSAGRCPVRTRFDSGLEGALADESLLRHVFCNLLNNAAKYSEEGSPVDFNVRRDAGDAVFEVIDRGIGIPLSDQPRMFEAFQRASNIGETPGTGLGLLIAKRCVELHGGTIAFKSAAGEGTSFAVRLPLFR